MSATTDFLSDLQSGLTVWDLQNNKDLMLKWRCDVMDSQKTIITATRYSETFLVTHKGNALEVDVSTFVPRPNGHKIALTRGSAEPVVARNPATVSFAPVGQAPRSIAEMFLAKPFEGHYDNKKDEHLCRFYGSAQGDGSSPINCTVDFRIRPAPAT